MAQKQRWLTLKGGYSLKVINFTQSLGAELLTNGNFAAWTTDNPDGWTVTGESGSDPEVSEVAANEGHGGSGTGAANLFSSATASQPRMNQAVLVAGNWYEFAIDITNYVSGGVRVGDSGLGGPNTPGNFGSVRTIKRLTPATDNQATIAAIGVAPHDVTIDNASVKLITQNAQQSAVANATFDFYFTIPEVTFAGFAIGMRYRIQNATNYWIAYINQKLDNSGWDFRLDSVVAGVQTNRVLVAGVGTPNGIRVNANGDNHTCSTTANSGSVWTPRGAVVSNNLFNTQVGVNTIYSPTVTPIELRVTA